MGEAAKLRLISALDDYVRSYAGDGGRSPRSAQSGTDADFVEAAQGLHQQLSKGSGEPDTPGSRAASRGAQGDGFAAAADRARDMLGGAQQAGSRGGEPAVG